ncbi:hypothetical protein EGT07_04410 [Herbaspirillum sp. HC18]|nr:hypothetical protein EGT07_04410 [Herbaspirillum sp. HC18]
MEVHIGHAAMMLPCKPEGAMLPYRISVHGFLPDTEILQYVPTKPFDLMLRRIVSVPISIGTMAGIDCVDDWLAGTIRTGVRKQI